MPWSSVPSPAAARRSRRWSTATMRPSTGSPGAIAATGPRPRTSRRRPASASPGRSSRSSGARPSPPGAMASCSTRRAMRCGRGARQGARRRHGDGRGLRTPTSRRSGSGAEDALWAAVRALPERQREAVQLVYVEGLSHREAGAPHRLRRGDGVLASFRGAARDQGKSGEDRAMTDPDHDIALRRLARAPVPPPPPERGRARSPPPGEPSRRRWRDARATRGASAAKGSAGAAASKFQHPFRVVEDDDAQQTGTGKRRRRRAGAAARRPHPAARPNRPACRRARPTIVPQSDPRRVELRADAAKEVSAPDSNSVAARRQRLRRLHGAGPEPTGLVAPEPRQDTAAVRRLLPLRRLQRPSAVAAHAGDARPGRGGAQPQSRATASSASRRTARRSRRSRRSRPSRSTPTPPPMPGSGRRSAGAPCRRPTRCASRR